MFITHQKGEIAQLKAQLRATEKGYIVSRPTVESRYDLLVDDGQTIKKVQIKYADNYATDGSVILDLRKETRNNGKKKLYNASEIDLLLVYVPKIDKVVSLGPELFADKKSITLRFAPPKKQTSKMLMVDSLFW
jgi:hypothetical protein